MRLCYAPPCCAIAGLVKLRLSRCPNLVDQDLVGLLQVSTNLEHLDLSYSPQAINDRTLQLLACYNRSVSLICPCCQSWRRTNYLGRISVMLSILFVFSFRLLRYLNLALPAASPKSLPSYKSSSSSISISTAMSYSSATVGVTCQGIASLMGLPYLEDLNLENHTGVSFEVLQSGLDRLPLLYRLNLQNCRSVSGPGLQRLVQCCPRLRDLDLRGCEQLKPNIREKIWEGAKSIVRYARMRREGWGFRPVAEANDYEYRDAYFDRKDLELQAALRIMYKYRVFR